jgi:hypothetical protein
VCGKQVCCVCFEQQADVSVVYATLHMGLDGLLSSSVWSEAAYFSVPTTQLSSSLTQSLRATTAMRSDVTHTYY